MFRRFSRIYRALFRRETQLVFAYRAEIVIWILTGVLPLVMLAAWLSIGAGGPIGSFSPQDFIAYYLGAIFVRQMTGVWIVWDIDYQIRQGEFSTLLLRPLNPIHSWLIHSLGSKWLRLLILVPIIGVALYVTGARYPVTPLTILAFTGSLIGAWLLSFLVQYVNGLLAFWMTQAGAVFDIWFGLWSILSGYLVPIDLLPAGVQRATFWLPFRYQLGVPLEILMGRLAGMELWTALLVQWIWIGAFFVLYRIMWRRGLRKYSAVGA